MAKKRRKSRKLSRKSSSRKSRHGILKRLERSLDKMGASTKYGGVSFRRARKQLGRGGRPRKGGLPPQLRGKGVVGTVLAATGLRPKKRSLKALIRLTGGYASPEQLSDAVEAGALTKDEAWLLDAHYQKARNARANRATLGKRGGMSRPKANRSARGRARRPTTTSSSGDWVVFERKSKKVLGLVKGPPGTGYGVAVMTVKYNEPYKGAKYVGKRLPDGVDFDVRPKG